MRRTIMLLTVGAIVAVVMAMSAAPAMAATPSLYLGTNATGLSTGNGDFSGTGTIGDYSWAGVNAPSASGGKFTGVDTYGAWLNGNNIL